MELWFSVVTGIAHWFLCLSPQRHWGYNDITWFTWRNSKYAINYRSRQGKYKGLWDLRVDNPIEDVKSVRKKQGLHSCSHLFPLLPYEEAQRKASHSSMRGALLTLKMVRGSNLGYLNLRTVRSLTRKAFPARLAWLLEPKRALHAQTTWD